MSDSINRLVLVDQLLDIERYDNESVLFSSLSPDEEGRLPSLCFRELDARARAVAATLQASNLGDQRVLLLFPPGIEFVVGLLGAFYARSVAVPVAVPRRKKLLPQLEGIYENAGARAFLTTRALLDSQKAWCDESPHLPLCDLDRDRWGSL